MPTGINNNSDLKPFAKDHENILSHILSTGKNYNVTFKEFAEVKFALVDQMWHHSLVKTNDLKDQSLEHDDLGCLCNIKYTSPSNSL